MGVNDRWVCGASGQLLYMLPDYCEMSSGLLSDRRCMIW